MNDGGGEPLAEQRNDTGGPGLRACSINVYCNSGTVSIISNISYQINIYLIYKNNKYYKYTSKF